MTKNKEQVKRSASGKGSAMSGKDKGTNMSSSKPGSKPSRSQSER